MAFIAMWWVLCGTVGAAVIGAGAIVVSYSVGWRFPDLTTRQRVMLRAVGILLIAAAAFAPAMLAILSSAG